MPRIIGDKRPIAAKINPTAHLDGADIFRFDTNMGKKHLRDILLIIAASTAAAGCAGKTLKPEIASSEDSPEYAVGYPASLNTSLTRYTEETAEAKENISALPGYADAVGDADAAVAAEVFEEADRTGRGRAYAERTAEAAAVQSFFDREKDDIARRINGGVSAAKEKAGCQCELDTYGTVSYGLKEGVEKRLEKSLEETGERSRLLSQHEKELGKKNAERLSDQAAAIARTAHVVYVSLPMLYDEMQRLLSEAKAVKKTLDRELEDEKAAEAASTSKADKKAAKKRIQELEDARNAVDIFVGEADRLVSTAETDIPAIRSSYDKSLKALLDNLRAKKP